MKNTLLVCLAITYSLIGEKTGQYFFDSPHDKLVFLAGKLNLPYKEVETFEFSNLELEIFKTRSAIAAYLLRDCEEIIEIGSYKCPIFNFVDNKKIFVTAIDPRTPALQTEQIKCLPILFQDWDIQLHSQNYGVLLLGLDLHMPTSGWEKLYKLINGAKRTVIEFPPDYKESVAKFERIIDNVNKHVTMTMLLDFSHNTFPNFEKSWGLFPTRKLCILE